MKFFSIILFLLSFAVAQTQTVPSLESSADSDTANTTVNTDTARTFYPERLAVVGGSIVLGYTAAWYYLFRDGWWDQSVALNMEGQYHDFHYATNLDKFGHFYTGVLFGEVFTQAYDWVGLTPFQSVLWAGITLGATQIIVELKDGFSPYGYSIYDAAAGTLGGFYAMGKRYIPAMKYVDYKFAYWRNSEAYWDLGDGTSNHLFTDDYPNQTHWLSFKIAKMLPSNVAQHYPDWLAFAFGWGITAERYTYDDFDKGRYEFYLSIDYDLEGLFKPKQTWAKNIVTILNHIKLPAPAVRLCPNAKFYPIMPIHAFSVSF